MFGQPMKRGISHRQLESPQENCVAVLEDCSGSAYDRGRRLYNKIHSEARDPVMQKRYSRRSRREGFRQENPDRLSILSNKTSSSNSSRSQKLLGRMKMRREYSKTNSSKKNGASSKCMVVAEDEEEDRQTMPIVDSDDVSFEYEERPPYPYSYPSRMPPGAHPPPFPYYMQQPQIVIAQSPNTWGGAGQQQGMWNPGMDSGLNHQNWQQHLEHQRLQQQLQKQFLDQQVLNQQQEEVLRHQREQFEKQRELFRNESQKYRDTEINHEVEDSSSTPQLVSSNSFKLRTKTSEDEREKNPLFTKEFIDKLQEKLDADESSDELSLNSPTNMERRVSERNTDINIRESSKLGNVSSSKRYTDEFSVGILGIGDKSVLEKTISLLKRNSFSDKFNPSRDNEGGAKPRSGMHSSFVESTKDGLSNPKQSQVLKKASLRVEPRESLELDFNDVYNAGKKESFRIDTNRRSFRRNDSSDTNGRHFAFENPHFSH